MRDFSEAPFLVIWETTQACDLACRHCRASAIPSRHPAELDTAEARALLDRIKEFGDPLMVFTGGDPLRRPDVFELLSYSVGIGLRTTVTPSATPLLSEDAAARIRDCGVSRMAVSVDGPDAVSHDDFRQVDGSFARTVAALVEREGARLWSVFFLIATGRAEASYDLAAAEYEEVFDFLYRTSLKASFDIKTTEAQHYRRYVAQQRKAHPSVRTGQAPNNIARQAGINDGKGFVFISHTGEIFPSGFLELSAGNVRRTSLADAYRNSELFRVLRDSTQLEGKCGACEYRNLCGGSRSRAYALTGSYLASDPRCVYQPAAAIG